MPSHHGPSSEPKLISISRRASSGDASQMLAKDQSRKPREEQREEDRLLGGGKYRDSNAVRIRPGEGRKRIVPGSSAAFKPANHLNRNGRESGPVRAQGKTQPTALPEKNRPRLDEPFDFDQATRPNKRPRNNEHARPRDAIGKRATQLSLQTSPQRRVSPVSSETSGKIERNVIPRQQEEYRQVEEYMKMHRNHPRSRHNRRRPNQSEIPDEVFTSQAAKERRAAVELAADFSEREHVPKLNVRSKSPQRVAHSRESPDVLQGDITIPRLPKPTTTKQISGRQNPNNEPSPSPSRKRSPSDIQPTDFTSSPIQGSKRAKRSHKFSTRFEVKYLRFGPFKKQPHAEEPLVFHVDQNQEKIQLGRIICDSDEHENASIELRRIIGALLGDSESHKIRLKLAVRSELPHDTVDIEFKTLPEKEKFSALVREKINKIQIKPSVFMDRAFDHYGIKMAELSREPKMSFIEAAPSERERTRQPPTRQKISSTLQGDSEDLREKTDHINRNKLAEPLAKRGVEDDASKIQRVENEKGEEIPVKKFQPKPETERQTRSTGRRSTRLSDLFKNDDDGSTDLFSKYPLKEDPFRKEWKQPLVYPQNGKKKAEVTVEDRDRLRDDEFLNDNLIAFYMRFLQDHMERTNPEAAKQVYFFNSYFYDTLTKTPRGQRGINYSGVAKWTRNVNLFEYNYVVVPINQSAHWYVAIICNLPKLLGETEAIEAKPDVEESASSNDKSPLNQTESEVHEILESPEPEAGQSMNQAGRSTESPASQSARACLASMSLENESGPGATEDSSGEPGKEPPREEKQANETETDKGTDSKEPSSSDEWPAEDDHHTPPPKLSTTSLKSKPTGPTPDPLPASQTPTTKKKGKGGQKYDPDQTTIITFDSLDLARSPTVRILRDYICEESSSKRGKGVEPKDIKGMRARQIPLQPNFSDCGLYLLAYLEKFVQDPDQFITKLLQREMDEKDDWPPLGSGLLRQRLRDFLDQLYREQERVKAGKCGAGPAGPKQEFLADQQPISHLLGPSSSSEADVEKKVDKSPEKTKTGDGSEKKEASENLPEKSRRSDSESDSDDSSTVDQLQLVPTGTAPTVSMTISSAPSGKDRSKNDSRQKKDEEVVEVPDSQEAKRDPSPIPSEAQPPKTEKKKGKADEPSKGKKSDLSKKNPTPTVEIQIRATPPPPSSPGKVRKSPRGGREKR